MPKDCNNKVLSVANLIGIVKWIVTAVTITITVLVFYFTRETKQTEAITKVTTTLANHVEQADKTFEKFDKTFDKFDHTMMEQHTINEKSSNALTLVTERQEQLKEENGRLADSVEKLAEEVRNNNGHTP